MLLDSEYPRLEEALTMTLYREKLSSFFEKFRTYEYFLILTEPCDHLVN